MPYSISTDQSGGFWVENQNTGRRMNKHPLTKRRARRYQMALYANESKGSEPMNSVKHGGDHNPFNAKQKDSLQAIHNHAADLGAECDANYEDEEMAKHLKHGLFDVEEKKDKVQAMHDHTLHLGADCPPSEAEKHASDKLELVKKTYAKSAEYAVQELGDIITAAYALAQLAQLSNEMEEPQDATEVANIMRSILEFIHGEIDEMDTAANELEEEKHIHFKAPKKDGPDSDYLVVDKEGQHLRVKRNGTPDHRLMGGAWAALFSPGGHRGNKYEGGGASEAKVKLRALYRSEKLDFPQEEGKSFAEVKNTHEHEHTHDGVTHSHPHVHGDGIDHADPNAHNHTHESKGLQLDYVKSLGWVELPDLAVKYVGKNEIISPAFIWGNPNQLDIEKDFFTRPGSEKGTNLFDDVYGKSPRPLTWDHAQDASFPAENVVIGKTVDWVDDDIARWATHVITIDRQYRKILDQFIDEKRLGASSDSVPQYVLREQSGKGHWIKRWPWVGTALTPAPAEPRMKDYTPEFLKAWNLGLPEATQKNDAKSRQVASLLLREKELKLKSLVK